VTLQLPVFPIVAGMLRPSVPVEGPLPVGWLPSPVSVGTITLFAWDGAGGGNPPSGGMGAGARGGGAVVAAEPQATEISAKTPSPDWQQKRPHHDVMAKS
jgi:hypothetical protein